MSYYAGETMRLTARNLTHSDTGPVTAGATVTIALYNPDGTLNTSSTASTGGSGDDWYVDVAAPLTPGEYAVKVTASVASATWKARGSIRVEAF
jgi:hypothetical protein